MSAFPASRPRLFWPFVAGLACALAWIALVLTDADPMLGSGQFHAALRAAAVLATAVAGVLILERLALGVLLRPASGRPITGLQRAIVFALLTFVVSFTALSFLGFDLRAVLATSAIATAAVGLALQPTLTSLISGLNVQLDAVLRVGDKIEYEGQEVTVVSMNWRTTVGRRRDGLTVVMTNSRLAESPLLLERQGEQSMLDISFSAPLRVSPARISEVVLDVLIDMEAIDATLPMSVAPAAYHARQGTTRYRLNCWMKADVDRIRVQGEVVRRLWYAFQRRRIRLPVSSLLAGPRGAEIEALGAPDRLAWLMAPFLSQDHADADARKALAEGCELLMYAPGERLTAPERTAEGSFLILKGRIVRAAPFGRAQWSDDAVELSDVQARHVASAGIAAELSLLIGPYGEYAVWRAAREAADPADLRRRVAAEIADPQARADFLGRAEPVVEVSHAAGEVLDCRRDSTGVLTCGRGYRARDEVLLLAIPAAMAETFERLRAPGAVASLAARARQAIQADEAISGDLPGDAER